MKKHKRLPPEHAIYLKFGKQLCKGFAEGINHTIPWLRTKAGETSEECFTAIHEVLKAGGDSVKKINVSNLDTRKETNE